MMGMVDGVVASVVSIVGILIILFWLVFVAAFIGAMVFWIMMIVDVAKRQFPKPDDKTLWVLVVVLAGIVGAIIYYVIIKRNSVVQPNM
jgi:hypothetical protein